MTLLLIGSLDSCLEISDIIEGIEYPDDVDTVSDGLLHEILYQVISVVTVAQHILSSEQHLELGVGHLFPQCTKSLPGVFVQETYAGVESCTAPALGRIEAYLIHSREDGLHIVH